MWKKILRELINKAQRILWLPSSTTLSGEDLEKIVTTVNKFLINNGI